MLLLFLHKTLITRAFDLSAGSLKITCSNYIPNRITALLLCIAMVSYQLIGIPNAFFVPCSNDKLKLLSLTSLVSESTLIYGGTGVVISFCQG